MNDHSDRRITDVTEAVQALVEMMRTNGLTKVDVAIGDISIRLRSGELREVAVVTRPVIELADEPHIVPDTFDPGHVVTAPMIGTFYTSASPGEPPFVRSGDRVDAGQTIGIIEAMKIMNEISSDRGGIVAEVLAINAQAVEYGSPLLRLMTDESGG